MAKVKALGGSSVRIISTSKSSSKPSRASRSGDTKSIGSSVVKETRNGETRIIKPESTKIPESTKYQITDRQGNVRNLTEQGYKTYQIEQQRQQEQQQLILEQKQQVQQQEQVKATRFIQEAVNQTEQQKQQKAQQFFSSAIQKTRKEKIEKAQTIYASAIEKYNQPKPYTLKYAVAKYNVVEGKVSKFVTDKFINKKSLELQGKVKDDLRASPVRRAQAFISYGIGKEASEKPVTSYITFGAGYVAGAGTGAVFKGVSSLGSGGKATANILSTGATAGYVALRTPEFMKSKEKSRFLVRESVGLVGFSKGVKVGYQAGLPVRVRTTKAGTTKLVDVELGYGKQNIVGYKKVEFTPTFSNKVKTSVFRISKGGAPLRDISLKVDSKYLSFFKDKSGAVFRGGKRLSPKSRPQRRKETFRQAYDPRQFQRKGLEGLRETAPKDVKIRDLILEKTTLKTPERTEQKSIVLIERRVKSKEFGIKNPEALTRKQAKERDVTKRIVYNYEKVSKPKLVEVRYKLAQKKGTIKITKEKISLLKHGKEMNYMDIKPSDLAKREVYDVSNIIGKGNQLKILQKKMVSKDIIKNLPQQPTQKRQPLKQIEYKAPPQTQRQQQVSIFAGDVKVKGETAPLEVLQKQPKRKGFRENRYDVVYSNIQTRVQAEKQFSDIPSGQLIYKKGVGFTPAFLFKDSNKLEFPPTLRKGSNLNSIYRGEISGKEKSDIALGTRNLAEFKQDNFLAVRNKDKLSNKPKIRQDIKLGLSITPIFDNSQIIGQSIGQSLAQKQAQQPIQTTESSLKIKTNIGKSPYTPQINTLYNPIIKTPNIKPPLTPFIRPPQTPRYKPPYEPPLKQPPVPTSLLNIKFKNNFNEVGKTTKQKKKQPKGFSPTGYSAVLELVGKPTKAGIKTGLGLRPIEKVITPPKIKGLI